jgi:hypothetical protein
VIDAVLLFGLMNIAFEFVLLCMVSPRWRLRLLGSPSAKACMHVAFLSVNLMIHWGTLIGTMSAILAFISSIITIHGASLIFGSITDGRFYKTGLIRYKAAEIR